MRTRLAQRLALAANMVTCSEYAAAVAFGRSRMLCRRKSPRCRLSPKLRSQDLKSRAKSKRAACPHIRKKSTLRGSFPAFRPLPRSESKAYEPCDLALPAMAMLGAGAVPPGLNGQCMTTVVRSYCNIYQNGL